MLPKDGCGYFLSNDELYKMLQNKLIIKKRITSSENNFKQIEGVVGCFVFNKQQVPTTRRPDMSNIRLKVLNFEVYARFFFSNYYIKFSKSDEPLLFLIGIKATRK